MHDSRDDAERTTNAPARAGRGLLRRPWFWLLFVALAAGGYWAIDFVRRPVTADGARGSGGERAIPVTVAAAARADVPVVLDALGTVTSLRTVTVRSRVDGQLLRVNFREGQTVKAGEVLAEIDPRPFQVQLEQAQGQLARDRALLENARLDLERYRTLVAQDAASAQQLDTQQALVRQYEGAVKTDQGQVDNARLQLAYARITAPFSGRLGLRLVDPGNLVRAGDANGLVTITQVQPIGVTFALPEKDLAPVLARYREGKPMTVQALDRDQRQVLASGRLTTLDNQIDLATGTLKMKAEFANADGALFPNQFVNARLRIDLLAGATVVPTAAVQRGAPGTYVYLLQPDGTVALRRIETGPVDGERIVVVRGLAPGDRVVIDGVDNLRDGARVEAIDKAEAAQAGAQPAARPPAQRRRPR
ncbi:MAG: multidrug transporter subunit MdtA [Lautropia sp.]|nr:multidrug transporter subunit MdtA [Lautropia sp.]MCL4701349.1 MdtA/MuxA family multidrug efflux RND transporter periplasmic adaptor subunit [Burkholderiaceae bacterium]MDL1907492.1 MdtA/MuxA family multidrug efflux RND transporter periplasmic adaptor subunit [Betaproteobacteria bacterium PRO1]RIK86481.1 MAG: multidrug transporter subunit MdtA [Burkholderiales bacterium]